MALYILTIMPNLGFRYIRLYDTVTLTQSRLDLQSHQHHVLMHFNKYDKHSCCLICNKHISKRQGGYWTAFQTLPPCITTLADVRTALQARQTGWKPVPHMPQSNQGSAMQQSWFCQSSSPWFSHLPNSSYDCTNLLWHPANLAN